MAGEQAQLYERLGRVEQMLGEVLQLLKNGKSRAKYQAEYYAQRKETRLTETRPGLKNPERNNLNLPMGWDKRLQSKLEEWAEIAFRFKDARRGPFDFLEYLAYQWNNETYWHKVITRSGGYNHVFIGFSGSKPLRTKCTDCDLFGCVKRTSFTRAQRDQFADAHWWRWGYGVLGKVVNEMQDQHEERWLKLPKRFTRPLLLMMGGFGQVEVRQGLVFDPNEPDTAKVGKMYVYAKPDLDRGWNACKRGLFATEKPTFPCINAPTAQPSQSLAPATTTPPSPT